ncbi:MAG: HAD family phosphatase, partial [Saprospiraceae bacterium]|nr:HAD family phosphatase [Saprospiraceae bacterium]
MAFNQRTISHVFFDHDGTLVDTEHLAIEAMLEVLAPYGFSMSADEYSQRFPGLIDRHIVEIIRRDMHLDIPEFDVIRDDLRRRHRILFQER